MDNPWICMVIHGYQGILFVTKWHALQVERISTRPISTIFPRCASLRISRFPSFHIFWFSIILFYFISGGPPRIILEVFCLSVTFQKSQNHEKSPRVFPVIVFYEIHGNRCGIDVRSFPNPRFIQKRCFCCCFFTSWRITQFLYQVKELAQGLL